MYRMERVEGHTRVAYIVYTKDMGYLATLSWLNGRLVYDSHRPEMASVSARSFEDNARELDRVQS